LSTNKPFKGLLGRGFGPLQGFYLRGQHNPEKQGHTSMPLRDSDPRFECSSTSRPYTPLTAAIGSTID